MSDILIKTSTPLRKHTQSKNNFVGCVCLQVLLSVKGVYNEIVPINI